MEVPTSPDISTSSLVDEFGGLDLHLSDDFFNLDNSKAEDHYNLSSLGMPEQGLNIKQEFPSIEQIKKEHNTETSLKGNERTNKESKVPKGILIHYGKLISLKEKKLPNNLRRHVVSKRSQRNQWTLNIIKGS